jgi:hypothetical protein
MDVSEQLSNHTQQTISFFVKEIIEFLKEYLMILTSIKKICKKHEWTFDAKFISLKTKMLEFILFCISSKGKVLKMNLEYFTEKVLKQTQYTSTGHALLKLWFCDILPENKSVFENSDKLIKFSLVQRFLKKFKEDSFFIKSKLFF